MNSSEKYLPKGETLVYKTKPNIFLIIKPIVWLIIWIIISSSIFFNDSFKNRLYELMDINQLEGGTDYLATGVTVVGWLIIFLAVVGLIKSIMRYLSSDLLITNRRVINNFGIFNKVSNDYWFKNIHSINVEQPFWGRIMGYGTIMLTIGGGRKGYFTKISDPLEFRKRCQEEMDKTPGQH